MSNISDASSPSSPSLSSAAPTPILAAPAAPPTRHLDPSQLTSPTYTLEEPDREPSDPAFQATPLELAEITERRGRVGTLGWTRVKATAAFGPFEAEVSFYGSYESLEEAARAPERLEALGYIAHQIDEALQKAYADERGRKKGNCLLHGGNDRHLKALAALAFYSGE